MNRVVIAGALLVMAGCGKFAEEEHFESDVAACMSAGGSHLECAQKARDLECVREGSRYWADMPEHKNEELRYRCAAK